MKHNFTNLEIWKLGRGLTSDIYSITKNFPNDERFGLINQMRRASVSVISNISEGCGRDTTAQLSYFLELALGSLCELQSQIYVCLDQNYIDEKIAFKTIEEIKKIRKMTYSFKNYINNQSKQIQ